MTGLPRRCGFSRCAPAAGRIRRPRDRRFHAQPNACPRCGPRLELWTSGPGNGHWRRCVDERGGGVAAGIDCCGQRDRRFSLDDGCARRGGGGALRERKAREEKPFAVMAPSMEWIRSVCEVSDLEARLLESPEAPIVLLRRKDIHHSSFIIHHSSVAPGNPYLGVMLPYAPLHHLLLSELGFAVVATSGNLADEPICTDEHEALARLGTLADLFLVHNRPSRATWTIPLRAWRWGASWSCAGARLRTAADSSVGVIARGSGRRGASQEYRGHRRRTADLYQPAHRRPGDPAGQRGLRARDRQPGRALRFSS